MDEKFKELIKIRWEILPDIKDDLFLELKRKANRNKK